MKDQVENLRRRDIRAAAIYTGMTYEQQKVALSTTANGDRTTSSMSHPSVWNQRSFVSVSLAYQSALSLWMKHTASRNGVMTSVLVTSKSQRYGIWLHAKRAV